MLCHTITHFYAEPSPTTIFHTMLYCCMHPMGVPHPCFKLHYSLLYHALHFTNTFPHHVKARHAPYGRAGRRRGNGLGLRPLYFFWSHCRRLSVNGGKQQISNKIDQLSPTKLAYLFLICHVMRCNHQVRGSVRLIDVQYTSSSY